jgi:hypothetical protein
MSAEFGQLAHNALFWGVRELGGDEYLTSTDAIFAKL